MLVKSHTDVGWMKDLNCAGDMYLEYLVPYLNDKACVWFGHPYYFTVVGTIGTKKVSLVSDSDKQLTAKFNDDTTILELDKQPAMKFEVANVRRN